MPIDLRQIGDRLRAFRLGSGLSPEIVAERLGISRAALYKYEKEGITRLLVLERAAEVLEVPLAVLLGVDVEQFASAAAFFERLRQLEAGAEQVVAYFEPISFLLTSPNYLERLDVMLREALAEDSEGRAAAERALAVLAERWGQRRHRKPPVTSLVAAPQLARMVRTGLVGRDGLAAAEIRERQAWAREEVARIARLLADPPIGVQVGVIEAPPPSQTFEVLRLRDRAVVAVSPFRLAEHPNLTLGIASITAEPATVRLYENLAQSLWTRALKGAEAARLLDRILQEAPSAT